MQKIPLLLISVLQFMPILLSICPSSPFSLNLFFPQFSSLKCGCEIVAPCVLQIAIGDSYQSLLGESSARLPNLSNKSLKTPSCKKMPKRVNILFSFLITCVDRFIHDFSHIFQVLCRWTLSVKKNYRPVKYHNWRHALNVAQTMFAMLKTGKMERFMSDLEILGLLVACLCHDLDHRGTNNAFQTKTESPLAILYSTSTMEHHHFDQCVMILNSESNNIFQVILNFYYTYVIFHYMNGKSKFINFKKEQ